MTTESAASTPPSRPVAKPPLVRVGTGPVRPHFPERGPYGDTWIDPAEVVAVQDHVHDVHYRKRSRVTLRSGEAVVVYGTVDEVLADLAAPQSASTAQYGEADDAGGAR